MVRRICKQCGKEFWIAPSLIKRGGGKYCSKECHTNSMDKKIKFICPKCGKIILLKPSNAKRYPVHFCSKSCRNTYKYSGENSPFWKGDLVGYSGLHLWLTQNKSKPKVCKFCKVKKPQCLANLRGNYVRDINEFAWLCWKCHNDFDRNNPKLKSQITAGGEMNDNITKN